MTELAKTIPSDYGKMPENYDFSTKSKFNRLSRTEKNNYY